MADRDPVLADLAAMWRAVDPVPPALVDKVLVAVETENLDAEYELLHLVERSRDLAGARSAGEAVTISFSTGAFSLLLRVSEVSGIGTPSLNHLKFGVEFMDLDGDGNLDLIIGGNIYDTEPNTPRFDSGNGLWLRGDGRGHFTPVPAIESGFLARLFGRSFRLTQQVNRAGLPAYTLAARQA